MAATPKWQDIAAKKKDMFERHGVAMLNLQQVAQEFGCKDERTAKSSWSGWTFPVLRLAAECSTRLTCWPRLWWPGGGWCDGSSEHEKSPRRVRGHPPGAQCRALL